MMKHIYHHDASQRIVGKRQAFGIERQVHTVKFQNIGSNRLGKHFLEKSATRAYFQRFPLCGFDLFYFVDKALIPVSIQFP